MVLEEFFNHPLLLWELIAWIVSISLIRVIIKYAWKEGKKNGRKEYDEYKKWEKIFKDKNLPY